MTDQKFCKNHAEKQVVYLCMDQNCKSEPNCCILCIKNKHSKCDDQFIIEAAGSETQIKINSSTIDIKSLTDKLGSIIDLKFYEMQKQFGNLKKFFIQSFEAKEFVLEEMTDNFIMNLKKNHRVAYNKESK